MFPRNQVRWVGSRLHCFNGWLRVGKFCMKWADLRTQPASKDELNGPTQDGVRLLQWRLCCYKIPGCELQPVLAASAALVCWMIGTTNCTHAFVFDFSSATFSGVTIKVDKLMEQGC
jgi:hypothetical protein